MTPESLTLLQHYKNALSNELISGEQDFISPTTLTRLEARTAAAHRELVAHIEKLEDIAAKAAAVLTCLQEGDPTLITAQRDLADALV